MSTRAHIWYVDEQGKIKTVYCHQDWYVEYTGKLLKDFYWNNKLVKDLVDGWAIYTLGKVKGEQIKYEISDEFSKKYFDWDYWKQTIYFDRDRGMSDEKEIFSFNSVNSYKKTWYMLNAIEYSYLFKDNKWLVLKSNFIDWEFIKHMEFEEL